MLRTSDSASCIRCLLAGLCLAVFPPIESRAGGGTVLEEDVCIIWIDFYSAHFTAYQPATRGNEQFCRELPDTGETIFVLDYLHQSLKEVPVGFRIIRDVTGQGRFVKLKHIEQIDDLERHTVFHQPPVIRPDASLKIEHDFQQQGDYIGIISAGHPTRDTIYFAVFPFEVGASKLGYLVAVSVVLAGAAVLVLRRHRRSKSGSSGQEHGP